MRSAGAVQRTDSAFWLSGTEATVGAAGVAGFPGTRLVTGLLLKLATSRPSTSVSFRVPAPS